MARTVRTEQFLSALAEKTIEHHRFLKRGINQRRNAVEDLYGQPFIVYGDASNPGEFYISISPDYIYLSRYAFKFVIQPYQTTVTGGTDSVAVTVDNRNLTIEESQGNPHTHEIKPNPHNHTTRPHTHNLITGKSFIHTTSKDWEVWIAGVDITEYLQEQVMDMPNGWLGDKGEGVYPTNSLEEDADKVNFYDILDVVNVMYDEGRIADINKILKPELKQVQIKSDAPFGIQAYLYLKYDNVNR